MLKLLKRVYDREPPACPTEWHHWRAFVPVRTPEGHWTMGRVWRKKALDGRWLYKERPEHPEDFIDQAL